MAESHWTAPTPTGRSMTLNGSIEVRGEAGEIGDEIAVFDPDNILCGHAVLDSTGTYSLQVYGDDPATTGVDEGAEAGDALTLKIFDTSSGTEYVALAEDYLGGSMALSWSDGNYITADLRTPPAIVYVDAGRPDDSGDGASWATAKRSIQAAIDITSRRDAVLVKYGVYTLTSPVTISVHDLELISDDGTAADLASATPDAAQTILHGANSVRLLEVTNGIGGATLIRGFTFTNGNATGASLGSGLGGGIYIADASPSFKSCRILSNLANSSDGVDGLGGGVYITGAGASSSPTFTACTIRDNVANLQSTQGGGNGFGGGMAYTNFASPNLIDSQLNANQALVGGRISSFGKGGGVYVADTTSGGDLRGCTLFGNTALDGPGTGAGGGIYSASGSIQVRNGTIRSNHATSGSAIGGYGGGLYVGEYSSIQRNAIVTNGAQSEGGGIYTQGNTSLTGNTLVSNSAASGAGVFGNANAIEGNIFYNHSGGDGHALYAPAAQSILYNCFWNNTTNYSTATVTSTHELLDDPDFTNPGIHDYSLTYTSPCIDAYQSFPVSDPNEGWFQDMGAEEYTGTRHQIAVNGAGTYYLGGQVRSKLVVLFNNDLTSLDVTVHPGVEHPEAPAAGVQRWYEIVPTGSAHVFDLFLSYQDSELNGIDESIIGLSRQRGDGAFTEPVRHSSDTYANWIEASDQNTFSDWIITDNVAPTVTSTTPMPGAYVGLEATLWFTFSEPVYNFDISDLAFSDAEGPISVSLSGPVTSYDTITYFVDAVFPSSGMVTCTVAPESGNIVDATNLDVIPYSFTFGVDTTPPSLPELQTSAPSVLSLSNSSSIFITWSEATDAGAGVAGYSYVLSRDASDDPGTEYGSSILENYYYVNGDGTWYLHMRVSDFAGNWSDVGTYGPWTIDTEPPTAVLFDKPRPLSQESSPTLQVGGDDVQYYTFSLDGAPHSSVTSVATPISLTGLAAGTHTIEVLGKDTAGNWQTIATSYTWEIVSDSPLFYVTPGTTLAGNGPQGGPFAPASHELTVTNYGNVGGDFSVFHDAVDWLTVTPAGGTLASDDSQGISISVNSLANDLLPGVYTTTLRFGNDYFEEVFEARVFTLYVGHACSANLQVARETPLHLSGPEGGPFPAQSYAYSLTNIGGSALQWAASSDLGIAQFSPAGGTLAPHESVQVSISMDASQLQLLKSGLTMQRLSFNNQTNGVGSYTERFAIVVDAPAPTSDLSISRDRLPLFTGNVKQGFGPEAITYTLANSGSSVLTWSAAVTSPWLLLDTMAGALPPGGSVEVRAFLHPNAGAEMPGLQGGYVIFNLIGQESHFAEPVAFHHTGEQVSFAMEGPAPLHYRGPVGGPFTPAPHYLQIRNTGDAPFVYTLSSDASWLSLSADSGTIPAGGSQEVIVQLREHTESFGAGSYLGSIVLQDLTNETVYACPAFLQIDGIEGGYLVAADDESHHDEFVGPAGGPFTPAAIELSFGNAGDAPLSWSAGIDVPWLDLATSAGSLNPGSVERIGVSPNSQLQLLSAGLYTATVTVTNTTSGVGQVVEVIDVEIGTDREDIRVTGGVDQTVHGTVGGPFAPHHFKYLIVNDSDLPLHWSADTSESWLSFTPGSGTIEVGDGAFAQVEINGTAASLSPGAYTATARIFASDLAEPLTTETLRLVIHDTPLYSAQVTPLHGAMLSTESYSWEPLPLPDIHSFTYTITNHTTEPANWSISNGSSWLDISPSSLSLPAGGSAEVTVALNDNAGYEGSGIQQTDVHFIHQGLLVATRPIVLRVLDYQYGLNVEAGPLVFIGPPGGPFTQRESVVELSSTSDSETDWQISSEADWLALSAESGYLASRASIDIELSLRSTACLLAAGTYTSTLTVNSSESSYTLHAVLLIREPVMPRLSISPDEALIASGPGGGPFTPESADRSLINYGELPLAYAVMASGDPEWLLATRHTGSLPPGGELPLAAGFSPAANTLADGVYTSTISFINVGNPVNTVGGEVELTVATLPVAVLSGLPVDPTNSDAATITVGGANVDTYQYRLDGSAYTVAISSGTPISLSGLGDGLHTLEVLGSSAGGSVQETPTTYSWLVDTTAPPLPVLDSATPTFGPTSATSAALTWSAISDGGSGIAGFSWVVNQQSSSDPGSFIRGPALPSAVYFSGAGTWYLHVRAIDKAGNAGPVFSSAGWSYSTSPLDTDNDQLTDSWEEAYLDRVWLYGADDDPDGDFIPNWKEEALGLDPLVRNTLVDIFFDDFESGDLSLWDTTSATPPEVTSDLAAGGTYSMQLGSAPQSGSHTSFSEVNLTLPSDAAALTFAFDQRTQPDIDQNSRDAFAEALRLDQAVSYLQASTTGATTEAGEPIHGGIGTGNSIWFEIPAGAAARRLLLSVDPTFDGVLALYSGTSLSGLAQEDSASFFNWQHDAKLLASLNANTTYYVAIDSTGPGTGTLSLLATLHDVIATPDDLANRAPLAGPSGAVRSDNTTASKELDEPDHGGATGGHSLWFEWTAPFHGEVEFDTAGSAFVPAMAVYVGDPSSFASLQMLATGKEEDDSMNAPIVARFHAQASRTYYIAIDTADSGLGELLLAWHYTSPIPRPGTELALLVNGTVLNLGVAFDNAWRPRTIDLAPWAGQSVSLKLQGTHHAGGIARQVFADNVRVVATYATSNPRTLYVDYAANGLDDGSSWTDAYPLLQDALADAVPGDTIRVAVGIYSPGSAGSDRYATFQLVPGTTLIGGLNPNGQTETVLSGDIGYLGDPGDNAYHVVTGASNVRMSGFTISDGNADPSSVGGGQISSFAEPAALFGHEDFGGGLYAVNAYLELDNVTFSSNYARGEGGALYLEGSEAVITSGIFSTNSSATAAGAIFSAIRPLSVTTSVFADNSSGGFAGAIWLEENRAEISNSSFSSNSAAGGSGAILSEGSELILDSVSFRGNSALAAGGAIGQVATAANTRLSAASGLHVESGVFAENSASSGGAIFSELPVPVTIVNSTFNANSAVNSGGALRIADGSAQVLNSILWGNAAAIDAEISEATDNLVSAEYSIVAGGFAGVGNLASDPLFANAPGDLSLLRDSPAIDSAHSGAPAPVSDFQGNGRMDYLAAPNSGAGPVAYYDRGAYEFQGLPYVSVANNSVSESAGSGTFTLTIVPDSGDGFLLPVSLSDITATASDYDGQPFTVTVPAGVSEHTFTVPIHDDNLHEGDETFAVAIGPSDGADIGVGNAVMTILDDDAAPSFTVSPTASASESAGSVAVAITMSNFSALTESFSYTTTDGTALAGSHYTATSGSVSWTPSDSGSKSITIPLTDDLLDNDDRTFVVTFTQTAGTLPLVGPLTTTVTVTDDEPTPTISLSGAVVTEGETASVLISLSGPSASIVSVPFSIVPGTAQAGSDYIDTSQTITWAAGTNDSQLISIPTVDDLTAEQTETASLQLGTPTAATVTTGTATLTILDDDTPIVSLGTATASVAETAGAYTATFSVAGISDNPVSITYGTVDGSATDGTDFAGRSGTITWQPGETDSRTVGFPILDDSVYEGDESFQIVMSVGGNAALGSPASTTVTIVDTEDTPTFSIDDVTVDEGDGVATFTVTMVGTASTLYAQSFTTTDGTALAGSDYEATSATVSWAAGTTGPRSFSVIIHDDNLDEPTQSFTVSNGSDLTATGTIIDNDDTPLLTIADLTVTEGDAASVAVTMIGASEATVSVPFSTVAGTASEGSDFTSVSTTLSWTPGSTGERIVTVPTIGDLLPEVSETVFLMLGTPTGATLQSNQATLTILDDDLRTVSLPADTTVDEGDGSVELTFGVNGPSDATSFITVEAQGAGADIDAGPFTLTWLPGDAAPKSLTLNIVDDELFEGNESWTYGIIASGNALLPDSSFDITITDNDAQPLLSISSVTVTEDAGTADFVVTLTGKSANAISHTFTTSDGSATAPGDYTSTTAVVSWSAGTEGDRIISVPIIDDVLDEPNQSFSLSNGSITGTATIIDNDETPVLNIAGATVVEGETASLAVSLSGLSESLITASFSSTAVTALPGTDFTLTTTSLSWAPGTNATQHVQVATVDDAITEGTETAIVSIAYASGADVGTSAATLTITDNDSTTVILPGNQTVTEGDGPLELPVQLVGENAFPSSITIEQSSTGHADDLTPGPFTFSWAPGDVSPRTLTLVITDDDWHEGQEVVQYTVTALQNVYVETTSFTVTINDNDAEPEVTISSPTVSEGDGTASFTVTLSGTYPHDFLLPLTTEDITAIAGEDYTSTSATVGWSAGSDGPRTVHVPILDDELDEPTESFRLGNSDHGVFGVATIEDNDATPSLSVGDVSVAEGEVASIPVTLTGRSQQTISVLLTTSPGSAGLLDFTSTSATLSWSPGESGVRFVSVPTLQDELSEGTESFTVTLSNASGASIADATGTVSILDDDAASVSLPGDLIVDEGDGTVQAPFTLGAISTQTVSVTVALTSGSAADIGAGPYTLTWLPGADPEQTLAIPIVDDELYEGTESFTYSVIASTHALLEGSSFTVTILDNDPEPVLSMADISVSEGDGTAVFRPTLTGASAAPVSVTFSTANGTATAGSDYTAQTTTVTWSPGTTGGIDVAVALIDDELDEPDEIFHLVDTASSLIATATIVDNDATPTISITGDSVTEGESASVTVSLSGLSQSTVTVELATVADSAVAGDDFTAATTTLSWSPGTNDLRTLSIATIDDSVAEQTESFRVQLSNPVAAELVGDGSAVVTIVDNDVPLVSLPTTATANEGDGRLEVPVSIVGISDATTSITVSLREEATDLAGGPFTLTWAPGDSDSKTLTVSIDDDDLYEGTEIFHFDLISSVNALTPNTVLTVTLTDNESEPTVSLADTSVNEADGAATLEVTLSGATTQPVSVQYTTVDGSATASSDYTFTSGTIAWSPGTSGSQAITIPILDDSIYEGDESFTVVLSSPSGAGIGVGTGTVTIRENEEEPSLRVTTIRTSETVYAGILTATVELVGRASYPISISYASTDGTALAGSDYEAVSGTLTWPALTSGPRSFAIPIIGDDMYEDEESFEIVYTYGESTIRGTVTIVDDDPIPSLSALSTSVGEGAGTGTVTVLMSGRSEKAVSVSFATSAGTATPGADYTDTSGTLSWAPGESGARTFTFSVIEDTLGEPNETVLVQLSDPANATLATAESIIRIIDNDTPQVSALDATVNEQNGFINGTVNLNIPNSQPVSVQVQLVGESATVGSDFQALSGVVTWPAGASGDRTFRIRLFEDTLYEGDETFRIELSNATVNIAKHGTITILDNDPLPSFSVADLQMAEGSAGNLLRSAEVAITMTGRSQAPVTVAYQTLDVTATAPEDYTASSGTLTWSSGTTGAKVVSIPVVQDAWPEPDESFKLVLLSSTLGTLSKDSGTVTLLNDDAEPSLAVSPVSVSEAAGSVAIDLRFAGVSLEPASVDYSLVPLTATAGEDYTPASGTITWAPLESGIRTITVPIIDDALAELDEQFQVQLSNAINLTLVNATATVTIIDDEQPTVSLSSASSVHEEAGQLTLTATMEGLSSQPVWVGYRAIDGTAKAGLDFPPTTGVLRWEPGETGAKIITMPIINDTTYEQNPYESFAFELENATGATLLEHRVEITIIDTDPNVTVDVLDGTIVEGPGEGLVTVRMTGSTNMPVTVDYATIGGTAVIGQDYTPASGTLTWAPNESGDRTFAIPLIDNDYFEPTTFITVQISNFNGSASTGVGATDIGRATATITLEDDEQQPQIVVEDTSVDEGGLATVTIRIDTPSFEPVSATWTTEDLTATAGSDYVSASGQVSWSAFTAGAQTITVQTLDDDEPEGVAEHFGIRLSNISGGIAGNGGIGYVQIDDNDATQHLLYAFALRGNRYTSSAAPVSRGGYIVFSPLQEQLSVVWFTPGSRPLTGGIESWHEQQLMISGIPYGPGYVMIGSASTAGSEGAMSSYAYRRLLGRLFPGIEVGNGEPMAVAATFSGEVHDGDASAGSLGLLSLSARIDLVGTRDLNAGNLTHRGAVAAVYEDLFGEAPATTAPGAAPAAIAPAAADDIVRVYTIGLSMLRLTQEGNAVNRYYLGKLAYRPSTHDMKALLTWRENGQVRHRIEDWSNGPGMLYTTLQLPTPYEQVTTLDDGEGGEELVHTLLYGAQRSSLASYGLEVVVPARHTGVARRQFADGTVELGNVATVIDLESMLQAESMGQTPEQALQQHLPQ